MAKSKPKTHLFSVKFIGPGRKARSVPMGVLGETLVAFQHIIHKCYLYKEKRLHPGARLTHRERNALALQLLEYDNVSETYGFTPFPTDPSKITPLIPIVKLALQILRGYVRKSIVRPPKTPRQNLVSMEYNQVKDITRQIDRNITKIEITTSINRIGKITINKDTHKYIRALASKKYPGGETKISGFIIRLDPMQEWVDINDFNNKRIHVFLLKGEEDFRKIRDAERDAVFEFTGVWRWKIGSDMEEIKRFDASEVTQLRKKKVTR